MSSTNSVRYTGIAIGLHWLIAILIISMLAIGKYMTFLPDSDPIRFSLTQWHKSFGITLLLLSIFRILWRTSHKPPALPESTPRWEILAAGITHFVLYALIIAIPLSGWIMVSASPLGLKTLLFQTIPWPHFPGIADLANKESIADLFHNFHEISSSVLILLLILHIGAALKHKIVSKDDIMSRMSPINTDGKAVGGIKLFSIGALLGVFAIFAIVFMPNKSIPLSAGSTHVTFTAAMFGSDLKGVFTDANATLTLDPDNPSTGSLEAVVKTASFATGDSQVDQSIPDPDWFDVAQYPEATFNSTSISSGDLGEIFVKGEITIKGITKDISFPMKVDTDSTPNIATGGFTVNRLDFDLGKLGQPTDETVGFNVLIGFELELN